jgi:hypothetical protein
MVRGKHSNYCIGIFPQKKERSETDCGSSVAADGLGNHLRLRQPRELPQDRRTKVAVGDDPEAIRRCEGEQARYGLLDHGLLPIQREQLLRPLFAA